MLLLLPSLLLLLSVSLTDASRLQNYRNTSQKIPGPDDDEDEPQQIQMRSKAASASTAWQSMCRRYDRIEPVERDLLFGVLFNDNPLDRQINKETILPAIQLAIERVSRAGGPLAGFNISIDYRDTRESSVYGPLEAMEMHLKRCPVVFFGPINEYVVAPVARYSFVWDTPVISPGGISDSFRMKTNFPMLTCMRPSARSMVPIVLDILLHFQWRRVAFIIQNEFKMQGRGDSVYSFQMGGLFYQGLNMLITTSIQLTADDMRTGHAKYMEYLQSITNMSRSACGFGVNSGWDHAMRSSFLNTCDSVSHPFVAHSCAPVRQLVDHSRHYAGRRRAEHGRQR